MTAPKVTIAQIRALVEAAVNAADDSARLSTVRNKIRELYSPMSEDAIKDDVVRTLLGMANVFAINTDEAIEANDEMRKAVFSDITSLELTLGGKRNIERNPLTIKPVTETNAVKPDAVFRCDGFGEGAVLTIGEVAVLSGQGGIGKSTLALQWAFEMAHSSPRKSAGIELYPDRLANTTPSVVYASAEDAEWVIRQRSQRLIRRQGETMPQALHYIDLKGRVLFEPDIGDYTGPPKTTDDFDELWKHVAAVKARLVVIDPVMAVFAGNENRVVEVRMFISALTEMAVKHQCAVLLLAHNTKAARSRDADPYDTGHVAGSASWQDGVRGVLSFARPAQGEEEEWEDWQVRRVLRVIKANYGMSNIECELTAIPVSEDDRAIRLFSDGKWVMPKRKQKQSSGGKAKRTGKAAIDADLSAEAKANAEWIEANNAV